MPYIEREDGVRFVIPSYRDVVSAGNLTTLKKEMSLLCKSYGEYITLQKITPLRFEAAFSPDAGYLLGETVWEELKRPTDLIYCEAIPNTMDAVLVIVKDGSVYLDGRFTLESIPDELIIFLTQQSHFEIYIYGDVPISEHPIEGKFSFEAGSVKTFTVLEKPLFPELPLLKQYQLQIMDTALRAQGVGATSPVKMIVIAVALGVAWMAWSFLSAPKAVVTQIITTQINPYQGFEAALSSPAPDQELSGLITLLNELTGLPGWVANEVTYEGGAVTIIATSKGATISSLTDWAARNHMKVELSTESIQLTTSISNKKRSIPKNIYPLSDIVMTLTDKLSFVYSGNVLKLGEVENRGPYSEQGIIVTMGQSSPAVMALLASQFKDLPLVLESVKLSRDSSGFYTGEINLRAFGT